MTLAFDKTITFCADLIPRVMDGTKTQTRRVDKRIAWGMRNIPIRCPYGVVGDVLGVLEGYQVYGRGRGERQLAVRYLADGHEAVCCLSPAEWGRWSDRKRRFAATPSRFMYRSLVRTRVRLTDVRVEPVQDITDEAIVAEGIDIGKNPYSPEDRMCRDFDVDFETAFRDLWDCINAKRGYSFDLNPLVWALTFTKLEEGQ